MSTDTTLLLSERLDKLPENIYRVLLADETKKNLHSLTDLLQIPVREKELIENYLMFTLLMCLPIDLFPSQIASETSLSKEQAQNVLTQFLNSLPPDVQSDLKLISEDLLEAYEESPDATAAMKKNSLSHLEQNFKSLREEALQSKPTSVTPPVGSPVPENLPTGEPVANDLADGETPTIAIPQAITKTSYTVEPMRTMAGDVTRVHGYGAYRDLFPDEAGEQTHKEEVIKSAPQEELLQEKPILTQKPTYGNE